MAKGFDMKLRWARLMIAILSVAFVPSGLYATASAVRSSSVAPAFIGRCENPHGLGISRVIEINPTTGPLHLGFATYPRSLDLADHEVVLTFDDGPGPITTPAVLDALKQECVLATFFLIGQHARIHPELVQREVYEGHSVGHHSMTHPEASLRFLSADIGRREIDEGIAAVEAAGWPGAARGIYNPHVPFFRFPGFADTPELLSELDQRKIAVFGCDLWAGDWNKMTAEHERELVMTGLARIGHRGIILFHDTEPWTAQMLPGLLSDFKAAGYKIVFLLPSETAAAPAVREAPPGWRSATNAIIVRRQTLLQRAATRYLDNSPSIPAKLGHESSSEGKVPVLSPWEGTPAR